MYKVFNFKAFIVLLFTIWGSIHVSKAVLNPVVLVPGDGGSQVDAKLNKSNAVHYICDKISDYFNIWLNMELLVPVVIDCWIDNMKLLYDNVTRTTRNPDGVETRIPGFGSSETVEWLDPSHASTGAYFKTIADALVSVGLGRNKSIRGAPYDFRKGPSENQDFFVKLKALVEETYSQNGNSSVMLIAHSMGGPMSLMFLNKQSQQWKDKHIRSLVTLSGAWGGSIKAIKVYAIGDDLGSYLLRENIMRQEQITNPSLAWMMPSTLFWNTSEVLVQTANKNFTLANIRGFFHDLQLMDQWEMYQDTLPYTLHLTHPGVEVHCLYGTAVNTVEKLVYKPSSWWSDYPTLIYGDGDGTVNRRSLEGCAQWEKTQSQSVTLVPLPKVDHMSILTHPDVIKYISNLFNRV